MKEDWVEWMHRLGVEFMKESPSHALRACMSLVDIHPPLARELFNAAFLSCWSELYDQYQVCFTLATLAHTYPKCNPAGRSSPFDRVRDRLEYGPTRPHPPFAQPC
jgi:Phosphatidylinositol kinase and protein kinases of the PI-3 kinase family